MNITALTWPLFIEIFLRTALNTCDVFMLSGFSDDAVSAVGVVGQLSFFLIIISAMISSGSGILIAQYNGSERKQESTFVGLASIVMSVFVGLFLSVLAVLASHYFLPLYGLDPQVHAFAKQYLLITGVMTFNVTIGVILTTLIRSHGYSKSPMVINLVSGVINVIGNYIALYQPFGLPVYGVAGVAVATVVSQVFATACIWLVIRRSDIELPFAEVKQIPRNIYARILRLGVLNAGEGLSYNLAQICLSFIIVKLGSASLAAFTYATSISRISFSFALALGMGSQIQAGYYIGRGWIDSIVSKVQRYFVVGFVVSTSISITIYLLRDTLIPLFTSDPEVMLLTASLIAATIAVEPGRVFNLIFINALKASGDVKFPVQMGVVSMWLCGVGIGYLLGVHWGYGVVGVMLAMALDEWLRGIIMARRWRSRVWTRFSV